MHFGKVEADSEEVMRAFVQLPDRVEEVQEFEVSRISETLAGPVQHTLLSDLVFTTTNVA